MYWLVLWKFQETMTNSVAKRSASAWFVALKYYFSLQGIRAPWRNGWSKKWTIEDQAILSHQIARKEIKSTRAMSKEFGNQLEEASNDQRWDNLTIRKDNNFNGYIRGISSCEFIMVFKNTDLPPIEDVREPTYYVENW